MVLCAISALAQADNLVGGASVVDGDTLEIQGNRIRLWGIDAPESSQLSRDDDSNLYRCGVKAANELDAFIADRVAACAAVDKDRYGRTVAVCRVNGTDAGEWMVQQGWALDWPRYSRRRHAAAQSDAEKNTRGIWSGSYVEPWRYRACIAAGGRPAVCSDEAH